MLIRFTSSFRVEASASAPSGEMGTAMGDVASSAAYCFCSCLPSFLSSPAALPVVVQIGGSGKSGVHLFPFALFCVQHAQVGCSLQEYASTRPSSTRCPTSKPVRKFVSLDRLSISKYFMLLLPLERCTVSRRLWLVYSMQVGRVALRQPAGTQQREKVTQRCGSEEKC